MAWRSSGSSNDELVNNLKRFRVISSMEVEQGFRSVDRVHFVPKFFRDIAHTDQPLKDGNIHISAPHIYGSVLEALELRNNSSISFLNAGSGTGYLSCIAACILGPRSTHYCVEIHEDTIQHCKQAISAWKASSPVRQELGQFEILRGNTLEIDASQGELAMGYDRIYIGAAIDEEHLPLFKMLLKPGGILVGPVEDKLVKVVRLHTQTQDGLADFNEQVLSSVRFSPLVAHPNLPTVIPAQVWNPSIHRYYPDSFRAACKEVMLCSHASTKQEVKAQPKEFTNAASMLPKALWMEVLSFTNRDWFNSSESEVEMLRRRLEEQTTQAEKANKARLEAEQRCLLAEKERDVYRMLARRWKSRLNVATGAEEYEEMNDMNLQEAAASVLLGQRDPIAAALGLGGMFQRYRRVAGSQGEDDSDSDSDIFDGGDADRMEEDEDSPDEDMDNDDGRSRGQPTQAVPGSAMAISARPQVRTVSISGEDI